MSALSASSLWRAEKCAASVVLPQHKREYADAVAGTKAHAALEAAAPPGSYPEVAFAYDVLADGAREVGRSIGRNYGQLSGSEIPGTADLVTVQPDHVLVQDYKTGIGKFVSAPADNAQLQHNALCAATVYGKPRAIVEVIYTRTGEVLAADFDCFDFDMIRARLRRIWQATQEPPTPAEGEWCWRCPATKACPLKRGRK